MLNELSVSLQKRGFWTSVENDELILDKDYIIIEFYTLLEVLHTVGIDFVKGDKGIKIIGELTTGMLQEIEQLPKRAALKSLPREKEFEPIGYYNGAYNLSVLELEPEIASLVFALNKVGFYTASSKWIENGLSILSHYKEHIDTINLVIQKANEFISLDNKWNVVLLERAYSIQMIGTKNVQDDAWKLASFFIQCFPSIGDSELETWG